MVAGREAAARPVPIPADGTVIAGGLYDASLGGARVQYVPKWPLGEDWSAAVAAADINLSKRGLTDRQQRIHRAVAAAVA